MRNLCSVMAVFCLYAYGAAAQSPAPSGVTVHVLDSSGKAVPGADVTLVVTSKQSDSTASGQTDNNGKFTTQVALGAASFSLQVDREGFVSRIISGDGSPQSVIEVQLAPLSQTAADQAAPSPGQQQVELQQMQPVQPNGQPGSAGGAAQNADWRTLLWSACIEVLLPLLIALAPLIAFYVLRAATVRSLVFLMMRKAPERSVGIPIPDPAPPASPGPPLEFFRINSTNGVLLNGAAQERLERTENSGPETRQAFLYSLVAARVATLLVCGIYAQFSPNRSDLGITVLAGSGYLALSALIALYIYLLVRRVSVWAAGIMVLLTAGLGVVCAVLKLLPAYLSLLPAIAQGACVWLLLSRLRHRTLADGNRRLLILRVFGSDKNTAFTFGSLMSKWRYVGSFLTIVDPSYVRYQFQALHPLNRVQTAGTGMLFTGLTYLALSFGGLVSLAFPSLLPSGWEGMNSNDKATYLANFGYLVVTPLAILPVFVYVKSRFASSVEKATKSIDQAVVSGQRLRLAGVFRGYPMWCHDDVWKAVVRKMLASSDIVLMDLRGFTPERKGCVYEIGELIDRFPAERMVFLVSDDAEQSGLLGLIRHRWSWMSDESPNRRTQEPVLKIYESRVKAKTKDLRRDLERVIALLSACVDEKAPTAIRRAATAS